MPFKTLIFLFVLLAYGAWSMLLQLTRYVDYFLTYLLCNKLTTNRSTWNLNITAVVKLRLMPSRFSRWFRLRVAVRLLTINGRQIIRATRSAKQRQLATRSKSTLQFDDVRLRSWSDLTDSRMDYSDEAGKKHTHRHWKYVRKSAWHPVAAVIQQRKHHRTLTIQNI